MNQELWWSYLADYDGKPGSTVVNLAYKRRAPVNDFKFLLTTGVSHKSASTPSGLPDAPELDQLNRLSNKGRKLITQKTTSHFVGSFTHNGERLDYFYIKDATGLETLLTDFYKAECPERRPYISVKEDPKWEVYLEFLYPNSSTIERNRAELLRMGAL